MKNPFNIGISSGIFAILCITFLFVSCFKRDVTSNKTSEFKTLINTDQAYSVQLSSGGNTVLYSTRDEAGKIVSELKITATNSTEYQTKYTLDTAIADYRLLQHGKIQEMAKDLGTGKSISDYSNLSSLCKELIDKIFTQSDIRKKHTQSIFFHYAILTTKVRGLESGNDTYVCLPHPGYILGRTYFWCQEDLMIDTKLIKDVFKEHPELLNIAKSKDVYDYINSVTETSISFDKLYAFSVSKTAYLENLKNIIERNQLTTAGGVKTNGVGVKINMVSDCAWWCPLGCGSDWGCCGNYSGCCLFASWVCYLHDRLCTDCFNKTICFDGCIPD